MYRPARKLKAFDLIVWDEYLASAYLYPKEYPRQATVSLFGFVRNSRGKRLGRVPLRHLREVWRELLAGDNFCTIAGREGGPYWLEVWKHDFGERKATAIS